MVSFSVVFLVTILQFGIAIDSPSIGLREGQNLCDYDTWENQEEPPQIPGISINLPICFNACIERGCSGGGFCIGDTCTCFSCPEIIPTSPPVDPDACEIPVQESNTTATTSTPETQPITEPSVEDTAIVPDIEASTEQPIEVFTTVEEIETTTASATQAIDLLTPDQEIETPTEQAIEETTFEEAIEAPITQEPEETTWSWFPLRPQRHIA